MAARGRQTDRSRRGAIPDARRPQEFSDRGFLTAPRRPSRDAGRRWPEVPPGVEARVVERDELERLVPGIRPRWRRALFEPGCADIDVAALHAAYLARSSDASAGRSRPERRLASASRTGDGWTSRRSRTDRRLTAPIIVNAAGAWADDVATACAVVPLGIAPKRRTMVQLRVGRSGLQATCRWSTTPTAPSISRARATTRVWLSPHDEIASDPCDAAPEEIDVATAIDRFERWSTGRSSASSAAGPAFAASRLTACRSTASMPMQSGLFLVRRAGRLRNPDLAGGGETMRCIVLGEELDPTSRNRP